MKKYEYIARPLLSQDDLNKLGQDGWELVCVNVTMYIFKREIPESILDKNGKVRKNQVGPK
jgi:hypothetical protein